MSSLRIAFGSDVDLFLNVQLYSANQEVKSLKKISIVRQNVSVIHKLKKPKTRSASYETEYQLEHILRKINFEKLRISNDLGMMFCKIAL